MKIITLASGKGGVGKTTGAVMLAWKLSEKFPGRVLLIDLDPNNNATDMALRDADLDEITARNSYYVLLGKQKIEDAIFTSSLHEGLRVIPAIPRLSRIGRELGDNPAVYLKIPSLLRALDFEYIVIDTPPALTLELRVALYSSDLILVPVSASRWTVQGFDLMSEEVDEVYEATGKRPKVLALPSMITEKRAEVLRDALGSGVQFTNTSILKAGSLEKAGTEARLPKPENLATTMFEELALEVM